jgi:RimJ/RimL family protein N-acetyltransferase
MLLPASRAAANPRGSAPMGEPGPESLLRTFSPSYPIETERLLVRPYTYDDFDALYAMHSRPEVTRFVPWETRDAEETRRALERKVERRSLAEAGDAIGLAVALRQEGTVIGDLSLWWVTREHAGGEIGFLFHPDHHGHGYAREAVLVLFQLGFEELGLHRLIGRVDARNSPSIRLMEHVGMRREAHLVENEFIKGEWTDEVIYAILRREWRPDA